MLPKLEGFAVALMGSLNQTDLSMVESELTSLEQAILGQANLRAVLTDTSITGNARGSILRDLLTDKVGAPTLRLSVYAATSVHAQEVPRVLDELAGAARVLLESGKFPQESLGLTAARKRVGGFADELLDVIDTSIFSVIEEELFRWARTIEASVELRRLLLDRDAPLESRIGATHQLLSGKVNSVTLRLAQYVIVGGRPRDVVGTLDFLVDYVARARDWRVARVHTARPLVATDQEKLVDSLETLTGQNVELQIAEEPALLGGVLVEVGDLRLDATTLGRLEALHSAVASGHLYESSLNANE